MIFRLLLVFTIISNLTTAQTPVSVNKALVFVDSLLKKEQLTVEVLDFSFPADLQEIMFRYQQSILENKEWALEYFSKNYKDGKGVPYNEKFGISREEYEKVKNNDNSNVTVSIKKSVPIKINRTSNSITFTTSDEEIKIIELLKIDLRNQIMIFNLDTIPFDSEINAPTSTPLGEWHGYAWQKQSSNFGENDVLNISKLRTKIIQVQFGKVKSNNKSLLRIQYKEVNTGEIMANLDLACFLN